MGMLDDDKATATALSAGRVAFGLSSLLTPRLAGKIIGFPGAEVTPSAIVMARFFGVREVAIGAVSLLWLREHEPTRMFAALNGAVDAGDTIFCALSLGSKGSPKRALIGSLALSAPYAALWFRMAQRRS